MRMIGQLPSAASARTFSDFLFVQGIENEIEPEKNGSWLIWVRSEEEIGSAKLHLDYYLQRPDDGRFRHAQDLARVERIRQERAEAQRAGLRLMPRPADVAAPRMGALSISLMAIAAGVSFVSNFGKDLRPILGLFISQYVPSGPVGLGRLEDLIEVGHGEIWRLITPIFVHFGIVHLVFNLLCLKAVGPMIERAIGPARLALLVAIIAGISNLGQYLVSGPSFGGLSGVIFGLMAYAWIRGMRQPASGLYVETSTVTMMAIWFVLCLAGVIPHVANTVHALGLGMGLILGFLSAWAANRP